MKKDIEWLKKEISTEMIELEPNRKERWSDVKYQTLRDVAQKIYQLDEPEILSQEWVDEHMYYVEDRGSSMVYVSDLQNLLVPKKELPVIPKFVAEWIERNQENEPSNTIHFIIFYLYANLPDTSSMVERRKPVVNWLDEDGYNYFKLIDAVRYGYEVEEEQKYYVLDSEDIPLIQKTNNHIFKTTTGLSIYEDGRDNTRFEFTEQEIKDYDERYFAFAVTVESKELF